MFCYFLRLLLIPALLFEVYKADEWCIQTPPLPFTGFVGDGTYDPAVVVSDRTECQNECYNQGLLVSAVWKTFYCFCGNSLAGLTNATNTTCDSIDGMYMMNAIPGDISVINNIDPGTGIGVGTFLTGSNIIMTPTVMLISPVTTIFYKYSYRDRYNRWENSPDTSTIQRKINYPGVYEIRSQSLKPISMRSILEVATQFLVIENVANMSIVCPTYGVVYIIATCNITMTAGSSMTGSVTINGVASETLTLADLYYERAGPVPNFFSNNFLTSATLAGIYVTGAVFAYPGTVTYLEFYASKLGSIDFLLLQPNCSNNYCFSFSNCSADATCNNRQLKTENITTLLVDYKINQLFPYTITTIGYQVITLSSPWTVKSGYRLGFHSQTLTDVIASTVIRQGETASFFSNTHTIAVNTILTAASMTANFVTIQLSAVAVPTRTYSLRFVFNTTGMMNISVTLSANAQSPVTATSSIDIVPNINDTTFMAPFTAATSIPKMIQLLPLTGGYLQFFWNFGDNTVANTTVPNVNHTYSSRGTYNVSVIVYNNVVSRNQSVLYLAIDPVVMASFSGTNLSYPNTAVNFRVTLTSGDNATCTLSGDSFTNITQPATNLVFSGTFISPGYYNMRMDCYNAISSVFMLWTQIIMTNITGLKFTTLGGPINMTTYINFTWTTGSNITFQFLFNNITTAITKNESTLTGSSAAVFVPTISNIIAVLSATNLLSEIILVANLTFAEPITGLQIMTSSPYVPVNTTFTYNITMTTGSSVMTTVNFADGSIPDNFSGPNLIRWPNTYNASHKFSQPGPYLITVTANNTAGTVNATNIVYCITNLGNYTVVTNKQYLKKKDELKVTLTRTSGNPASMANLTIYWMDGSTTMVPYQNFNESDTFNHSYESNGVFNINVTLTNPVSSVSALSTVNIINAVTNFRCSNLPLNTWNGNTINFTSLLDSGDNVNLVFIPGNGGASQQTNLSITVVNTPYIFAYAYTAVGNYTSNITACNQLGCAQSCLASIQIQYKIIRTEFTVTSNGAVINLLELSKITLNFSGNNFPTSLSVTFNYFDGTTPIVAGLTNTNTPYIQSKNLSVTGYLNVSVTLSNLANSEVFYIQLGAFDKFVGFAVTATWGPSRQSGSGPTKSIFPMQQMIYFAPKPGSKGTVLYYVFMFVPLKNLNNVYTCNATLVGGAFGYTFTAVGDYNVSFIAINPLDQGYANMILTIGGSMKDTTIIPPLYTLYPNYFGFVTITWAVINPTACICVSLGNGTKVIYGATSGCTKCSDYVYTNIQPVNSQIRMSVRYPVAGDYNIVVFVYDSLESVTVNRTIPITSVQCSMPIVSMMNLTYMNTDSPQVGLKGSQITVNALILDLPCVVTKNNEKIWTAVMIDPLYFTPNKTINLTSILTNNNTQLIIPPLFLDYGLYKLTFTVTMDKNITTYTFMNMSSTYLRVVASPVIVALSSGGMTVLVKGIQETICLSATNFSMDPDLKQQNFNNWKWSWACRNSQEPANLSRIVYPKPAEYSFTSPKTGCFGDGPGLVNFTANSCFAASNMIVDNSYVIDLNGTSGDGRYGSAKISLSIVNGIPPTIIIQCMKAFLCAIKQDGEYPFSEVSFNPSDALLLNASCTLASGQSCSGGSWKLRYKLKDQPSNLSFVPLSDSDSATYLRGIQSLQLAILPDLFVLYKTLERFQTCFYTQRLLPNGGACIQFFVNPLPWEVNCTVNGTTIKQTDTLCCNCSYVLGYNYRVYINASAQLTTLGFSTTGSFCSIIPYQMIPQTFMVRVTNTYGGYVDINVSQITITTLDSSSLNNIISSLLNGSDNTLNMVNAKGDLKTMAQVYLKYISVITVASQNSMQDVFGSATNNSKTTLGGSGYTQKVVVQGGPTIESLPADKRQIYENDRDSKSGIVNLMASNLVNMVPADVPSLYLVTSVTEAVTNSIDVLNRQAQNDISNKLVALAMNLKAMQSVASRDDIQKISGSILSSTFQCDTAVNSQISNGIVRDIKQSKDNFLDYDTNIESTKQSYAGNSDPDAASNLLTLEVNSNFQSKVSSNFGGNSVLTINTVTKVLRGITVCDDKPIEILSSHMQYYQQKSRINDFSGTSFTKGRSTIQLPDLCKALGTSDCSNPNKAVSLEIIATPSNTNAALPNSNGNGLPIPLETDTLTVNIFSGNNENEKQEKVNSSQEFKVALSRDPSFKITDFGLSDPNVTKPQIAAPQIIPGTGDIFTGPLYFQQKLIMHQFTLNGTDQSVHFQMKFNTSTNCAQFLVVARLLTPPTLSLPPDGSTDPDSGFKYWGMIPTDTKYCNIKPTSDDPDPFTFYIDNTVFNADKKNITATQPYYLKTLNVVYFGVRELTKKEWNLYTPTNRPPYPYVYSDQVNTTYLTRIFSSGCYSNSDGFKSAWKTTGCKVGPLTTPMYTQCICTHLTTFISGFVVAPNTINFNYVFSNFDLSKNQTLFVTEGVICLIFILMMIWARRKDIKDLEKIGVTPLVDNDMADQYLYEILVDTSIRNGAGTKSKVYFILSGESDETDARHIYDAHRDILQRGNIDRFLLAVPRSLGPLQYIRLWHDNSGKGPNASWYCNYFGVTDLQTKEKFHFLVNRWFAVEEDDGQVDRLIAVASAEELLLFGELFGRKMKHDLTENHLWLSIMARPPESRFTRLERVACCLLLMFLTMLTTCMFYKTDGPSKVTDNALVIGPLAITPREAWVGIISGIIGFVPLFIVIDLFRRSQLKHGHANKLREVVEDHLQLSLEKDYSKNTVGSVADLIKNEELDVSRPNTPGYRAPDQVDIEVIETSRVTNGEEKRRDPTEKPVVKGTRLWPWWVRIISWTILIVVFIIAFFFTTMYGIQFGDMACKKWISAMFISFFASVILIQPIKVIVLAVFFTLLCKNNSAFSETEFVDEEDELMNELGQRNGLLQDEEYLHGDLYTAPMKPRRRTVQPPSKDDIEKAREYRLKEIKMFDIIREIIFYIIFFATLLLVTYSFRDPMAYTLKTALEKVFVFPWNPDWQFGTIRREDQFWNWALNVLVPGLRAQLWYNNQPQIYQRGFLSDRNNRLMGYAVMRQLRVPKDSCKVYSYVQNLVKRCYGTYAMWNEDTGSYDVSWQTTNTTVPEFSYQTASQLSGIPYMGAVNVYSGGGFVYQFRSDAATLYSQVAALRDNRWLDFQTRAVIIQFTTYNPNINLFAINTFLLELPGSGGMWPSYRIEPANLLGVYSSGVTAFEILCQVLYGVFIFLMIIKEIRNIIKQKGTYFKQFWSWIDIFIIGGSFSCVAAFVYIRYGTSQLTQQFANTGGDAYMNFAFVGFWNEYMGYLTSFIVFAATLKFIKVLRFNRRIGMLGAVLSYCSKDMRQFFFIFMIMFLAFVMVFYCLFMDSLSRYHSFLFATESSMQIALGKFSFLELYQREPIFGPIVFACYVIFIIFVMLNMFIAILTEGFAVVRADIELQSNDFEIMDFILTKFILFTGISNTRLGHRLIKTSVTDQMYKEIDERELMAKVNSFPDKVDQLLNHINHIVGQGDMAGKGNKKGFSGVIFNNATAPSMAVRGCDDVNDNYQQGSRPGTATSNILTHRLDKEMPPIEK